MVFHYTRSFAKLCLNFCDPIGYTLPGSSVHGIFQARILEWVAISFSRGPSQLRDQICISCISCTGRQILYHCATCFHSVNILKLSQSLTNEHFGYLHLILLTLLS